MSATTQRLGNVLVGLGLTATAGGAALGLTAATAASTTLVAADPVGMAITASQAVVPDGAAEAVVFVDAADPVEQLLAAPALAALPLHVPLLLADTAGLSSDVRGEADRVTAGRVARTAYLVGGFAPAVAGSLEADGWSVVDVAGATALDTALALADQTFGAPVGTSQRVLFVSDRAADVYPSAMAAVYGANLGIPVLPVGTVAPSFPTLVREAIIVADPAVVGDDVAAGLSPAASPQAPGGVAPGSVTVTRIWDADPAAVASALHDRLVDEPQDGDLRGWLGEMPVIVEPEDAAVAPIAATVAARRSLDGHASALSTTTVDLGIEGATHLDLLASSADPVEPDPAPLPATGGGLAVAGVVTTTAGLLLRRRGAGRTP